MLIAKDEGTAARRRVPARLFTSNGTSPDTGALDDAVLMGVNSLVTISLASTMRAVNANNGMYCVELTASECSVLGIHPLYHTVGDFCQHFANVEVVSAQPYSSVSVFDPSAHSVGLKAVTHSGATTAGILDYSLLSGTKSNFSVRLDASAIYAASFQAGAIDAAALAAMEVSDVTFRITPMQYSGMTVEVNNLVGAFSAATVRVSGGTATGVTNRVVANVDQLNGTGTAILRLISHISSVVTFQTSAGTLAANAFTTDVAEATNDHFNGRVIVFTSGVLLGQATSINTSGGFIGSSNGSARFHVATMTEAPGDGDLGVIV